VTYAWSITKTHLKNIKDEKTWLKNQKNKMATKNDEITTSNNMGIKKKTFEISQGTPFG
jgi:hypothetical protein